MSDLIASTFVVLLVVIDPIGLAPLFGALTLGGSVQYRRRMAIRGSLVALGILVLFAVGGDTVFSYLGVGIPAFRIAGGALLFLLAIDMVFARQSGLRSTTHREQAEAEHKTDISVFPLAIPLIAGPGALTTVLLVVSDHRGDYEVVAALLGIIAAVLALTCGSLLLAGRVMKILGETGANVISRVLGVVLAALAVQFILDGLRATFLTS